MKLVDMGAGGMGDMAVYKNTTTTSTDDDTPFYREDDGMELELIPEPDTKWSRSARFRRKVCLAALILCLISMCIGLVILAVLVKNFKADMNRTSVQPQALTGMLPTSHH